MFLKARSCSFSSEFVHGIIGASNDILNGVTDAADVFRNYGFRVRIRSRVWVTDGVDEWLNGANEERRGILKIIL